MYQMMNGSVMGGMGMGVFSLLVLVALVLSIAALSKYLFFSKK
jgi:K+-transporting ATPase A subunit